MDLGLIEQARYELARRQMIKFASYMQPQYKWNWHHLQIAEALDKFFRGEIKRVMLFVPPQHAKSEFTSRLFPAWALGKNPDLKIILASYSAALAESMNRDVQRYIDTEEYAKLFPDTKLQAAGANGKYIRNAERFDIIDHRGYFKSVGVGGSLTGTPADIAIIDDPHKDREEAKSALISQKVWDWYTDVLKTRLHNDSGVLLIQTRWDDMDLSGRLLKHMSDAIDRGDDSVEYWTVLCFPAIKESDDNPLDPRKVGEALWPEKHSLKRLMEIRSTSLRTFQSLYQQNPQPVQAGGECYKDFDMNLNTGDAEYNPELPLHFSFDFNVNPYMSCGVYQIDKEQVGDVMYYTAKKIEEICLRSPRNTTKGICEYIRNKYKARHKAGAYIYGDPNGMKEDTRSEKGHNDYLIIRQELADFRPSFRIATKAPPVRTRIDFMNSIFIGGVTGLKYTIDKRCVNTVNDYLYIKEESDGTKQKVKAIDPVTGINSEKYGHCFVGSTLIETGEGEKRIDDICVGDYVLTRYGYRKVTKAHDNGVREVRSYSIGGKGITCTPEHRIYADNAFVPISDLINSNTFCIFDRNKGICEQKLLITEVTDLQDTLMPQIGVNEYIIRGGLKSMGKVKSYATMFINGYAKLVKYLKDTTFTIRTRTPLTMTYQILPVFQQRSIFQGIGAVRQMSISNLKQISSLLKRRTKLKNGISLKMVWSGIGSTLNQFLTGIKNLWYAMSVNQNLCHQALALNISAPTDVRPDMFQESAGQTGKILFKEDALCVKRNSASISTSRSNVVVGNVPKNMQRVYDITVENDHEYFANGILVHNCSDHDEYFICNAFGNKFALYQNGGISSPIKVGKRVSRYIY